MGKLKIELSCVKLCVGVCKNRGSCHLWDHLPITTGKRRHVQVRVGEGQKVRTQQPNKNNKQSKKLPEIGGQFEFKRGISLSKLNNGK